MQKVALTIGKPCPKGFADVPSCWTTQAAKASTDLSLKMLNLCEDTLPRYYEFGQRLYTGTPMQMAPYRDAVGIVIEASPSVVQHGEDLGRLRRLGACADLTVRTTGAAAINASGGSVIDPLPTSVGRTDE